MKKFPYTLIKKSIFIALAAMLYFSHGMFSSAYFAKFGLTAGPMDFTLSSLQDATATIDVLFDESFLFGGAEAPYTISRYAPCFVYDEEGMCVESPSDLCPYVSLVPANSESSEVGFQLNPLNPYDAAIGALYMSTSESDDDNTLDDRSDAWEVSVTSPCFEGECPSDYNPLINGSPLPISQKGKVFMCNLLVESSDIPVLIKNLTNSVTAYASEFPNEISVRATLNGSSEPINLECCSNVAFLPGNGGSRLYTPGLFGEDRLWEPNGINDLNQLMLATSTGASLLQNIYVKDLVDETLIRIDEWPGTNTYKTFAKYMDEELVETGLVNEWKPLVYDWRLGLPDVITRGTVLGKENGIEKISYLAATSTGYIIQELNRLAGSSQTGKVTIVTHSNGGLVAKYLVKYLIDNQNPLLQKIDKIVFVAVPQLGTPEATAMLLHGTSAVGKGAARNLSEDMKSAYHLLPSRKYFDVLQTPIFTFSDEIGNINELSGLDGMSLNTYAEVRDFMTGRNGQWQDPEVGDIDTPNVLDNSLLDYANGIHAALDELSIPSNIAVTQIAGVGIDTVRGIAYDDCDGSLCSDALSHLDRDLLKTKRGDGTVVLPSAMLNLQGDKVYVDIKRYNSDGGIFSLNNNRNRKHGSIFEVDDLQETLKSVILNLPITFNDVVKDQEPLISSNDVSFSFTLHSPLTLHLYDSQNRHTGLVSGTSEIRYAEENIPNSYYREFGEVKYAGASADDLVTMKLVGENNGIFTLKIEKTIADTISESAMFEDVPVTIGMLVTIPTVSPDISLRNIQLAIDVDANGVVDTVIDQGSGISMEEWIGFLKGYINKLNVSDKKKVQLQKIFIRLEKIIEKEKGCENKKKKDKCEFRLKVGSDLVKSRLGAAIEKFYKKGLINLDEYNQIKDIIKNNL